MTDSTWDMEPFDPERMRGTQPEPSPELNQLAHDLIGAAIEVHRELRPGYAEAVYEEALCVELELRGIPYQRQVRFCVEYKGRRVGEGRIDLLINEQLIVDLKAVESHNPLYERQVLSYLTAMRRQLGLLINVNVPVLRKGIKRVINS